MIGFIAGMAGLLLGGVLGWWFGGRGVREAYGRPLLELSRRLRAGEIPWEQEGGSAGSGSNPPEIQHLQESLRSGWVPAELCRQESVDQALDRIGGYLRHQVELPLLEGVERGGDQLRIRANRVLDALDDLGFFLSTEMPHALDRQNVITLLQEVTREWTNEFSSPMSLTSDDPVIHARVAPDAFKDALYLVLANAGRYGKGHPVEVKVETEGAQVRIRVGDRGPGFSPDALERGLEPLFTTDPGALGLGLSHARRVFEALEGEVHLRNREGGGGEVEIILPLD